MRFVYLTTILKVMDTRFDDSMPVLFSEKMFDRLEGDTKLQLSCFFLLALGFILYFWVDIDNNTRKKNTAAPMRYMQ